MLQGLVFILVLTAPGGEAMRAGEYRTLDACINAKWAGSGISGYRLKCTAERLGA